MLRATLLLSCLGCLVWGASADPSPADHWRPLADGVWEQRLQMRGADTQIPVEVQGLRVDLTQARVAVIDARRLGQPALTAHEMLDKTGATAVLNASFFLEGFEPMGLLLDGGDELNPIRKADWGVFFVDARGRAGVTHTRDWERSRPAKVALAIQSGPRLVVDGKPTTLKPNLARRSAVCLTSRQGEVVLVATRQPVLISEFATWLSEPPERGGLGCRHALNFDGGSSTQLAVRGSGLGLGIRNINPVPIGLAVETRPVASKPNPAPQTSTPQTGTPPAR